MCQFFSCVSDGKGNVMYFDAEMRKKVIAGETEYQDTDSHTSIAHWYGFRGRDQDTLNKYEYNPLTKRFTADQLNTADDSEEVERFCKTLDFLTVVPELIIKPIIHPLRDIEAGTVGEREVELLKAWASVGNSVGNSVWASVGNSVGNSVWDSVGNSVGDSVGNSVGNSVWDSVGNSVWASVWAYISNFFTLKKWRYINHTGGENPFQPCIDLWESGFVPSFDGRTWRLHAGQDAEIVYEWPPEAMEA